MKFDTNVQLTKYQVLKKVSEFAYEDKLLYALHDIPKTLSHEDIIRNQCCIYKERAILSERVKVAMGKVGDGQNIIQVLPIACDDCPQSGYSITTDCRGCLANMCIKACPVGAIKFEERKAIIDKNKCVECGRCEKACPYSAVINRRRPCEKACPVGAISANEGKTAIIDYNKCINCGACVYQCPFGAVTDLSYITDVVQLLKNKENQKVYAIVAPAISSQCTEHSLEQVISAIRQIGFSDIIEVALGADIVSYKETDEFVEKDFLTSSCCPSFVDYVHKFFPELSEHVSHTPSPMMETARIIKNADPQSAVVFIGPCTSKKVEFQAKEQGLVDVVITFEELQALLDANQVIYQEISSGELNNASSFGRLFARSGGVTDAIQQAIKEKDLDITFNSLTCDGIAECKVALTKKKAGKLSENFIEGMTCKGGCISGSGCVTHGPKEKKEVDVYAKKAMEKQISDALLLVDFI